MAPLSRDNMFMLIFFVCAFSELTGAFWGEVSRGCQYQYDTRQLRDIFIDLTLTVLLESNK